MESIQTVSAATWRIIRDDWGGLRAFAKQKKVTHPFLSHKLLLYSPGILQNSNSFINMSFYL